MGKLENPVCQPCQIFERCKIRNPKVAKWGYEPAIWDDCAYFTCLPALRHAGKELNSGRPFRRYSLSNGNTILALSFDTPDKETRLFFQEKLFLAMEQFMEKQGGVLKKQGRKLFLNKVHPDR